MNGRIRVVVVDDQEVVRSGLRLMLDKDPDVMVVGEAADGLTGLAVVARTRPHVVLMDLRMPVLDGVEPTTRLLTMPPPTPRVLVLTTFDTDDLVLAALTAGASGFLLKDTAGSALVDAVRTVADGHAVLDPAVTRRVIDHATRNRPRADPRLDLLTSRETDVLRAMADGASNAEIGRRLFLGEATVKTHVGRILHKLQLRDRTQAVIWAHRTGLVDP